MFKRFREIILKLSTAQLFSLLAGIVFGVPLLMSAWEGVFPDRPITLPIDNFLLTLVFIAGGFMGFVLIKRRELPGLDKSPGWDKLPGANPIFIGYFLMITGWLFAIITLWIGFSNLLIK